MEYACRLIIGDTVRLDDGSDYRNAIFRQCKLEYHGGPVQIENALFFDCQIAWKDAAADHHALNQTILRSLYLQSRRTAIINADGTLSYS